MFSAAARRACASAPNALRHPQSFTRSLSNGARPAIHSRLNKPSQISFFPLVTKHARLQTRHMSFSQRWRLGFREAQKGIWRKNPILLPLAILSTIGAAAIFTYIAFVEVVHVGPQYTNFPPPVADALRTAIYYTDIDLNPSKALKAYKDALKIAAGMGMHPFSDEVIGIKINVAGMLEKAGLIKPSIEVLERTKSEMLKWVEDGRKKNKSVPKNGARTKKEAEQPKSDGGIQVNDPEILATQKKIEELEAYEELQRDKCTKRIVGIHIRLSELYASDHIQDEKKAEENQEAAVDLSLKELHRRESLGLPVGGKLDGEEEIGKESSWLNRSEIAVALADLAFIYTRSEKFELARPILLRALQLLREEEGKSPSCKQVMIMSAICVTIIEQLQRSRDLYPESAIEKAVDSATKWAHKALEFGGKIQPPVRNQDCDVGCIAATYHLGEIFEFQGKFSEAKKCFEDGRRMSEAQGYKDGLSIADEGLERLKKKSSK